MEEKILRNKKDTEDSHTEDLNFEPGGVENSNTTRPRKDLGHRGIGQEKERKAIGPQKSRVRTKNQTKGEKRNLPG